MNLADKPCYPIKQGTYQESNGITFREQLIIALASNPAIVSIGQGTDFATLLLKKVDAIIKEMDKTK